MDPADLERELHVRLNRVPRPRAPESLRARVMTAVAARRARPWYQRPWFTWPQQAQVVSLVVAGTAVVAAVVLGAAAMEYAGRAVLGPWQSLATMVDRAWPTPLRRGVEVLEAARVVWRVLLGPAVFYASAFIVVVGGFFAMCVAVLMQSPFDRKAA